MAKRDRLWINATNLAALTIDVRRAKVTCDVKLTVVSDGPLKIKLAGCP